MEDDRDTPVSGEAEVYHGEADSGMRIRAFGLNIRIPDDKKTSKEQSVKKYYGSGYRHGRKARKLFLLFPTVLGSMLLGALAIGWLFMLVIGALFHEFGILQPVGYWPALGISLGLLVIFSMLGSGVRGG